jgi:hypothetical protein
VLILLTLGGLLALIDAGCGAGWAAGHAGPGLFAGLSA